MAARNFLSQFAMVVVMSTLVSSQTLKPAAAITDPKQITAKPSADVEQGEESLSLQRLYMTRLVAEVFFGVPRGKSASHAHESPAVMTIPLIVLAVGAVALGFLGTPAWPWLQAGLLGESAVHRDRTGCERYQNARSLGRKSGLVAEWTLPGLHGEAENFVIV